MTEWGETFVKSSAFKGGPTGKFPFMQRTGLYESLDLVSVAHGATIFEWQATSELVSLDGIIQGGVLSMVADICQGHTYMSTLPAFEGFSTGDLTMRFLAPVRAGDTITIASHVTTDAIRQKILETTFTDESKSIRAIATGNWKAARRAFKQSA